MSKDGLPQTLPNSANSADTAANSAFIRSSLLSRTPPGTPTKLINNDPRNAANSAVNDDEIMEINPSNQSETNAVNDLDFSVISQKSIDSAMQCLAATASINDPNAISNRVDGLKSTINGLISVIKNGQEVIKNQSSVNSDLNNRLLALEAKMSGDKTNSGASSIGLLSQSSKGTPRSLRRNVLPPAPSTRVQNRFEALSDSDEDVFIDKEARVILNQTKRKHKKASPTSQQEGTDKKKGTQNSPVKKKVKTTDVSERTEDPKETGTEPEKKKKVLKPPPIKVVSAKSFGEIQPILKSVAKDEDWRCQALRNDIFKINPLTDEAHRKISKELNEKGFKFYSFENKNTRPLRVMVKGLHPSIPSEEIMEDLISQGFKVLKVDNVIKKERVKGKGGEISIKATHLPYYILTFDRGEDKDKIYSIKAILNLIVKIEALRKNPTLVPQCHRCQGFGHTRGFCFKDPKCVKCAEIHWSTECPKGKTIDEPLCANCGEKHPASYRGCVVAKEVHEMRAKNIKNKKMTRPRDTMKENNTVPRYNAHRKDDVPYSSFFKNTAVPKTQPPPHTSETSIEKALSLILGKLDVLENSNAFLKSRLAALENAVAPKLPAGVQRSGTAAATARS